MLFKEGANCVSQLRVTRVQKIVNAEDTFNSQQSVSRFQVAPDIFALMVTVHMDPSEQVTVAAREAPDQPVRRLLFENNRARWFKGLYEHFRRINEIRTINEEEFIRLAGVHGQHHCRCAVVDPDLEKRTGQIQLSLESQQASGIAFLGRRAGNVTVAEIPSGLQAAGSCPIGLHDPRLQMESTNTWKGRNGALERRQFTGLNVHLDKSPATAACLP